MTTEILTQKELKKLLYYSPNFGIFVWKVAINSRAIKGNIAGSIHTGGYRMIKISGKRHPAHRLAFLYMHGRFPPEEVDHINGVRHDNSFSNLREVSSQENKKNRAISTNNTSGITGVVREEARGKWRAKIGVNGKSIHLGYFEDFEKACCARKSGESRYNYHPNHGRRA